MNLGDTFYLNNEEYEITDEFALMLPAEDEDETDEGWDWFLVRNVHTRDEYFLLFEDSDDFGYLLSESEEAVEREDWEYESGEVVTVLNSIFGYSEDMPVSIEHGRLLNRSLSEGIRGPLDNTSWITWFNGHIPFFQRPIYKEREGYFYTDTFPASDLETEKRKWRSVSSARFLPNLILILLMLGLGGAQYMTIGGWMPAGVPTPFLSAFWMVGLGSCVLLFFGRSLFVHRAVETFAAAFCFFLCFKMVDGWAYQTYQSDYAAVGQVMVVFRLACIGLFVLLQLTTRRWYAILQRASLYAAAWSIGIYLAGMLLWSLIDEYWWLSHFNFYLSAVPWAFIWPVIFLYFVYSKYKDFAAVPLTTKDFDEHLLQMIEDLQEGAEHILDHAKAISVLADDAYDAVNLSDESEVVAFEFFESDFEKLRDVLEECSGLASSEFENLDFIDEDLEILADDLEALRDALHEKRFKEELYGLRISPALQATAAKSKHLAS